MPLYTQSFAEFGLGKRFGYDLKESTLSSFSGMQGEERRQRPEITSNYARSCSLENFAQPIQNCYENKLLFTGHVLHEDSLDGPDRDAGLPWMRFCA